MFSAHAYTQTNTLPPSGNVGIGTTAPSAALQVNGKARIDSSLIVKDSVHIQKNLRVEQDVRFLGLAKMNDVKISNDFIANGISKFNGDVKLSNLAQVGANNYSNFSFLMANPNGLVKKTDETALGEYLKKLVYTATPILASPCQVPGYSDNPFWVSAPQKLYSECGDVYVGIGTKTPSHLLTVAGKARFYDHVWAGDAVSIGADQSNFSKLYIKNNNRTAGIELSQVGNPQTYSKLIYLEFSEPTTEILAVRNATLNTTPLSIKASGDMVINNGTADIFHLYSNGVLSLRGDNGDENFRVEGSGLVRARKIKVDTETWPDYVFETNYKLMPLNQLEEFINKHKHLPTIPDQKTIVKEGIDLGEMNLKLMEKVEELTLYLIQQNKELEKLKAEVELLNSIYNTKD
jgi:hypothetical protein